MLSFGLCYQLISFSSDECSNKGNNKRFGFKFNCKINNALYDFLKKLYLPNLTQPFLILTPLNQAYLTYPFLAVPTLPDLGGPWRTLADLGGPWRTVADLSEPWRTYSGLA